MTGKYVDANYRIAVYALLYSESQSFALDAKIRGIWVGRCDFQVPEGMIFCFSLEKLEARLFDYDISKTLWEVMNHKFQGKTVLYYSRLLVEKHQTCLRRTTSRYG